MSQKLKRYNSLVLKAAVAKLATKKNQRRRSNSHYCGHCSENLCMKVYKRHEKLYKRLDQSWISSTDQDSPRTLTGWLIKLTVKLITVIKYRQKALHGNASSLEIVPLDKAAQSLLRTEKQIGHI